MKVFLSTILSTILLFIFVVAIFPSQIKIFISGSIYPLIYDLPFVSQELNLFKYVSVKQQRKHEGLVHYVIDNFTDYSIDFYDLPFPSYDKWRSKPVAYIEQTDNKIIIASGSASFLYIDKENIDSKKVVFTPIESNIRQVISDDKFYRPGSVSIKDLKVIENFLYLSYTKKVSDDCYNVSVLRSKIDFNRLKFEEVFSPNECVDHQYRKQSGGRIFQYKEGKLLLSVGSMANNQEAQKIDSVFGKIISFTPMSNKYQVLSMGHRNPQGLYYDHIRDVIINTEHQALGADEINVNIVPDSKDIKNYGWPISSYSVHYNRKLVEEEPLHKSHSDFGFIEPSKYFTPALGISQIIKAPMELGHNDSIDYLVSSMGHGVSEGGDMSLHHIRFDSEYNNLIVADIIPIGERIRDLELLKNSNKILLILESIPAFAILSKKNYSCDKSKIPCNYDKKYIKTDEDQPMKVFRESYEHIFP